MIKRHSPYGGILHEVVEHGGILYFGGIVAEDISLDMGGQARDVLNQLAALLEAHGSDLDHVLQTTVFMTDLTQKGALNKAWAEFFKPESLPARAGIGVADLTAGVLLEITATAAVIAA